MFSNCGCWFLLLRIECIIQPEIFCIFFDRFSYSSLPTNRCSYLLPGYQHTTFPTCPIQAVTSPCLMSLKSTNSFFYVLFDFQMHIQKLNNDIIIILLFVSFCRTLSVIQNGRHFIGPAPQKFWRSLLPCSLYSVSFYRHELHLTVSVVNYHPQGKE